MTQIFMAGACQARDTQIGSACPKGVCPQVSDSDAPACSVASHVVQLQARGPTSFDGCVGYLPVDSIGRVDCEVRAVFGAADDGPVASGCGEPPWLPPDSFEQDPNTCFVRQLSYQDRADGTPQGWYYRSDAGHECPGFGAAIHFTEGTIPEGVEVQLHCAQALTLSDEDGAVEEIPVAECRLPNAAAGDQGVGNACVPTIVPEAGFDDREATVETGSLDCETGACLVYKLRGDPRSECVPAQPDADSGFPGRICVSGDTEVFYRVYCSCRCGAPEGDPGPLCDCPDEFSCVATHDDGPPGVRGSYCVRNGTFTGSP